MGMIEGFFALLFGGNRNVVKETVEVFRENAEAGSIRAHDVQLEAMRALSAEIAAPKKTGFDRFMDGLNRLPRPALALGTLTLFVSAMVSPLWFAERMQGMALVPEPLWWLLGVIVSFYFGARHQVKAQQFQRELVQSMAHVPQVIENVALLRSLRHDDVGAADTGHDPSLGQLALSDADNAALEEWRKA